LKTHSWQFDRHGDPAEVMHWREQALPQPGPGQAWVKIHAIGLNASDLNYVLGHYFPPQAFPSCQGQEAVGEVLALGPEVESRSPHFPELQVGSRVALLPMLVDTWGMGVFRDVGLYDTSALVPVPAGYSDAEGAAYWEGIMTMAGALDMAGIGPASGEDKTLMITAGASGMGVIALKLARAWGMQTIATTRKADKVTALEAISDHVVVCDNTEFMVKAVKELTGGLGADIILDPVGDDYYSALLECAAVGGNLVSYECMTGRETRLPIMDMMLKDLSIRGYTVHRLLNNPELIHRMLDIGQKYAEVVRPIIAGTYSLSAAPEALSDLGKAEHIGKLLLEC